MSLKFLGRAAFLGRVTVHVAFLYFYSWVIREISKHFERKYFTDDRAKGFPTTYLMTYADSRLSNRYKDKYRKLISDRFHFELLNKKEEAADPIEARKCLDDATGLVKKEVQDGYLVLKHNIWYGFCRNFIGGTIISMPVCILGIVLGFFFVEDNIILLSVLGILFFLYLIAFLFRKPILVYNGEAYAKHLFDEFISSETLECQR